MVKNPHANTGDIRDVGEILGRRVWQFTPVFLPGESHGQRAWPKENWMEKQREEEQTVQIPAFSEEEREM